MSKLDEKVALITGGSRGIGAAIAKRLAADGASVAITYAKRSEEHTSELQSLAYLVCRLLLEKKNTVLAWAYTKLYSASIRASARTGDTETALRLIRPPEPWFDRAPAWNNTFNKLCSAPAPALFH